MKRFFTFIATAALLSSFTLFLSIDEVVNAMKNWRCRTNCQTFWQYCGNNHAW